MIRSCRLLRLADCLTLSSGYRGNGNRVGRFRGVGPGTTGLNYVNNFTIVAMVTILAFRISYLEGVRGAGYCSVDISVIGFDNSAFFSSVSTTD